MTVTIEKLESIGSLSTSQSEQIEYYKVASYKMSSQGVSQTFYQPQIFHPVSHNPHSHQIQQHKNKAELVSINELSRVTSNSTTISMSSDIYLDAGHDYKVELNFTPGEISLVRSTWKEMTSDDIGKTDKTSSIGSSLFCIQFYSNLLAMDNNLEKLFPSIKHQAISFAGVLSTAIISLEKLDVLDDYLSNLGKRHARILGIEAPHFELMGVALLKTFKDRFGENLTLELERCWARLYTYLANSILQFGIDPIIKNDKVNEEFLSITRTTTVNSSNSTQASSIFDAHNNNSNFGRPVSYTNTVTAPPSLINQQRNGSVSSTSTKGHKSSNSKLPPLPNGNISTQPKGMRSKVGKSLSKNKDNRETDDEKCIIM